MVLPIVAALVLKILTKAPSEGISVTGAQIFLTIPMPIMDLHISESQVNSLAVLISLFGLILFLTRDLKVRPTSKRQVIAEWIVETVQNLVNSNMGERFAGFAPFITAILALSAYSSLSSMVGLFPPTSDVNITFGWAILVFGLITYYKLKGGLGYYIKGFFEPVFLFAPMNVIGEIATPVSMAFRHFGNVLSGVVVSTLIAAGLQVASSFIIGWLPGFLGNIPFLRFGIPAIFSIYFDIFSGCMQAFIFAMLTMLNIANNFPEEEYEKRLLAKREKALRRA
ncbi:MAG: F0F1 ATP synthase subunit A [Clostridia bacterium]|nr:F0F1 ATP synthase subunit A [Clostridia bacterium]